MSSYEKRMIQYVSDFMETSIASELADAEKTLILVIHDESCFGSNDGRSYCWIDENNRQIRPKGNGQSVMVSAFMCECHEILALSEELQTQHSEVERIVLDSQNRCNSSARILKEREALTIFKILHPNCDVLFMFDNSQNHHTKPPGGLRVTNINMKNGGMNQRLMRGRVDTLTVMVIALNRKRFWRMESPRKACHRFSESFLECKRGQKIISGQPHFSEQREWLEETLVQGGCLINYYPKYHCESNHIEIFWGAAKAWSRARFTSNFNDYVALVPQALERLSISKIRNFARKSNRYIDAYLIRDAGGNSLSRQQIEYVVKKYRGNRKIPIRILKTGTINTETPFFQLFKLRLFFGNELQQIIKLSCPLLYTNTANAKQAKKCSIR